MHSKQLKREEKTVVISLPVVQFMYIALTLSHWCLKEAFVEEKSGYDTKSTLRCVVFHTASCWSLRWTVQVHWSTSQVCWAEIWHQFDDQFSPYVWTWTNLFQNFKPKYQSMSCHQETNTLGFLSDRELENLSSQMSRKSISSYKHREYCYNISLLQHCVCVFIISSRQSLLCLVDLGKTYWCSQIRTELSCFCVDCPFTLLPVAQGRSWYQSIPKGTTSPCWPHFSFQGLRLSSCFSSDGKHRSLKNRREEKLD